MEYLSRSLARRTIRSDFHFHPKCEPLRIAHLVYADDLLLFSRGDVSSVTQLVESLSQFAQMAGLTTNLAKSSIYMAGIYPQTQNQLLTITGFQIGVMPFRYLRISIASQKLKISDYSTLLDSLTRRIGSWPKATLSYAGKAQLISSVLQGVECYWMSVLPLPQGVIDHIYSICRSFMWTSRRPPIAWSELVRPKREGGLGLRDLRAWNQALLAKVLWRVQDKQDTLWIRWIRPQMATYRCMLRTFRRQYQGISTFGKARHLAMSAMVHHIWMARNYNMFEGKRFDGELVFRKIQIHVFRTLGVLADQVLGHH
ncbi:uncharacterized protein LOC121972287 [Zingiber officinale]|uniref:uncharacterized protein LOC121972287 n=1 Tax=Zingiber officinale TaxID=94328 RepID=UPI001C4BB008|nr:uncharacterized protein LOC121972287 [Zingiber officinale]